MPYAETTEEVHHNLPGPSRSQNEPPQGKFFGQTDQPKLRKDNFLGRSTQEDWTESTLGGRVARSLPNLTSSGDGEGKRSFDRCPY